MSPHRRKCAAYSSTSKRGRNRPVLLHAKKRKGNNGVLRNHITASEAVDELGFQAMWVWHDDLNINVYAVEQALQQACDDLPLGRRLHRVSGSGAKGIDHPSFEGHGVYITFSDKVQNKIDAGEVVVNH